MNSWVQGSLARVKLDNFVTYDHVEFKTGPHLNIIIGPNGTGKSTIVCALCLGLGGKTNLLGRAREIGEFVKHGENKATIELELFNKDGLNYTIKRVITRENKSDWFINNKPKNLKDVVTLAKKLNIDVNNLCQFLPQDMVAEFAKMSPSQLLESTERAVGGQNLLDMHLKLITLKNEEKTLKNAQGSKEEYLDKLMKRNEYLKDIVNKHEERNNHLKKIEVLELKRPWLVYEHERLEFQKLKNGKAELASKVDVLRNAAQPLEIALEQKKNAQVEVESLIKDVTNELNKVSSSIKGTEQQLSSGKERIDELMVGFKSKVNEAETKLAKITQLTNEVNAYQQEMEALPETSDLKSRREAITTETRNIAKELGKLESAINELNIEEQARQSKKRTMSSQIQKLNDINNQKLENLRRFEKDTYNAVQWLRSNRGQFQGEILEPFQLIINVPNPSNAKYIESIISRNDRKAFIFERADDLNTFMRQLRDKQKLNINAVLAPKEDSSQRSLDFEKLRPLGFVGFLSDLIECPPLAKRYLYRYYRIHNVPIGSAATDKMADRVNKIIPSGLYFTPSYRYQNSKSRYHGGDIISSISQVRESRIFNFTVDTRKIQDFKSQLERLNGESLEANDRLNEVKRHQQELRTKDNGFREQKQVIVQQIRHRDTIEDKIRARTQKINELKNSSIDLEEEKAKCDQKTKQILQKCMGLQKKIYMLYLESETKNNLKNENMIRKIEVSFEVSEAEEQLQSSTQELQSAEEMLNNHADIIRRQRAKAAELLEEAKRVCGLTTNSLPNKYKSMFKRYPTNNVNDLDQQLNEAKALAECSNDLANPQMITEYNDRKKEIETYTKEVEVNQDKLKDLESQIHTVRESWYGPITEIIEKINTKFRSFFVKLQCAGEILLSEHEDYDKWGVDIRVQFRNSDDMKRLTSSYQSGGEKSVSTILYLLSLQGLTDCPFRVVDEINQGMDPKNERKVFEMMAAAATVQGTSQYFLITPKLLPDLRYNEKMNILSIFNGLQIDNNANESFVVENVIEQARFRNSQSQIMV